MPFSEEKSWEKHDSSSVLVPGARSGRREAYFPVPDNATVCGLPPPSSVTDKVAARAPVADGVNVTAIVHFPFAPTVPHVLLSEKSFALAPPIENPVTCTAVVPTFEKVRFFVTLECTLTFANFSAVGVILTCVPTPVSGTLCGLPAALSVIVTAAERVSSPNGVNTTLIEHDGSAAMHFRSHWSASSPWH